VQLLFRWENLTFITWRFNVTASRRNCIGLWSITLSSRVQFVFWFRRYGWQIQISLLQIYTLHPVNVTRSYHNIPWRLLDFFSQVQSLRTRIYHIDRGWSWTKFPDARNVRYSPRQKSRKRRKKENWPWKWTRSGLAVEKFDKSICACITYFPLFCHIMDNDSGMGVVCYTDIDLVPNFVLHFHTVHTAHCELIANYINTKKLTLIFWGATSPMYIKSQCIKLVWKTVINTTIYGIL